ncbi:hypothetical protein AAVH_28729 [Aphelenchoides avenae]|nr:hypothetical protein AAVH_28729 [Aphelenchus avenae]
MIPKVPYILATQTDFMINNKWPSDGVFPLGIQNHQALSRILSGVGGKQEVTLWLSGEPASHETPAPGGEITFGGKDTRNCGDRWTTIPNANTADWSVPIHSVRVGDNVTAVYNRERSGYARISLATPFLEVPSAKAIEVFRDFLSFATLRPPVIDVGLQPEQLTVNCSLIDSMPAIRINIGSGFGSISYTVPAKEFVARYPQPVCHVDDPRSCKIGDPPVCGLLIVEKLQQASSLLAGSRQATPDPDDVWVIGSQFLPKRCVRLDYANGEMSFADPLNRG